MVMGHNCKYFSGSIPYERLAARIYDRFALQYFGLRSHINLEYRLDEFETLVSEIEDQVQQMLSSEINNVPTPDTPELCPSDIIVLKGTISLA